MKKTNHIVYMIQIVKGRFIRGLILLVAVFITGKSYAVTTKYVAPEKRGSGNGLSQDNASDFLNTSFWMEVRNLLEKDAVSVRFVAGDYKKAYVSRPLLLHNIGNRKNVLLLEGAPFKTIFTAPESTVEKGVLIELKNAQNIIIRNFSFTGNGRLGYALKITSAEGSETKNITVENCSWTDMRGIVYGATGCHKSGTSDITYNNCTFKRIGIDSHSHHMYHAHSTKRINVVNSHFEDCTGDYVRFRDNCEYNTVRGSTFVRNGDFPAYPFISAPLFNNVDPGDESFSSNYTIKGNSFTNAKYAVAFHNYGYSAPGFNYLLSAEEGKTLKTGSSSEKKKLLLENFGIDAGKISISGNNYKQIETKVGMGSFAKYGAKSKGFDGWGDISELFD